MLQKILGALQTLVDRLISGAIPLREPDAEEKSAYLKDHAASLEGAPVDIFALAYILRVKLRHCLDSENPAAEDLLMAAYLAGHLLTMSGYYFERTASAFRWRSNFAHASERLLSLATKRMDFTRGLSKDEALSPRQQDIARRARAVAEKITAAAAAVIAEYPQLEARGLSREDAGLAVMMTFQDQPYARDMAAAEEALSALDSSDPETLFNRWIGECEVDYSLIQETLDTELKLKMHLYRLIVLLWNQAEQLPVMFFFARLLYAGMGEAEDRWVRTFEHLLADFIVALVESELPPDLLEQLVMQDLG